MRKQTDKKAVLVITAALILFQLVLAAAVLTGGIWLVVTVLRWLQVIP